MDTPRSGRTTSIIAESCNREKPILVLEPLTRIAEETVKDDMKYTEKQCLGFEINVIHIPSNRACKKIAAEIEEYPLLKKLPILPLPESALNVKNTTNVNIQKYAELWIME